MDRAPPPRRSRGGGGGSGGRGRRRGGGGGAGAPPPPPTPPRARKSRNRRRNAAPPPPPPPLVAVKLVVRRLPPTISANDFFSAADAHGAKPAVWRAFSPGSASASGAVKRTRTVVRHSVAYLGFSSQSAAEEFYNAFNGFRVEEPSPTPAAQPAEYIARVERAMWQAVPPLGATRRRGAPPPPPVTPGSIESDPDFLEFVAKLEADAAAGAASLLPQPGVLPPAADSSAPEKSGKGRVGVSTSLMEDVRARRKERDQKKKSTKPGTRAPRAKGGRTIVVTDPSARTSSSSSAPASVKPSGATSRRKKSRRGSGGEYAGGSAPGKKAEEVGTVGQKKGASSSKPPVNGRRGVANEGKPVNGSVNAHPRGNVSYQRGVSSESGSVAGNDKGGTVRNGSSRSRSARARAKAKAASAGGSAVGANGGSQAREGAQGAVRLLRKEASNGHKT